MLPEAPSISHVVHSTRILALQNYVFPSKNLNFAPRKHAIIISYSMKTTFLVIGKTTDRNLIALIDDYARRIGHYQPFEVEVIPELKNTKALSPEQQKQREAELLKRSLRPGDHIVLLDEGGREFRSIEFADYLRQRQAMGARRMVFIVGGPYGFAPEVYALAAEKISLSRMTFSHQMVRLFFVEQFYRAMTILKGEPYHHE